MLRRQELPSFSACRKQNSGAFRRNLDWAMWNAPATRKRPTSPTRNCSGFASLRRTRRRQSTKSLSGALWRARQGKRMMVLDARKGQFDWRITTAPLLGDWVVLLAMKHQRAPVPVSSALWKGLLRKGFPNDLDELAIFARRYLFLGDERLLLPELRIRTAITPPVRETLSKESKIAPAERRQIEDADKFQRAPT